MKEECQIVFVLLNFKRPLKRFVDLANRYKRSEGAITKLISEVIIEPTEEEEDKLAEGNEKVRIGALSM